MPRPEPYWAAYLPSWRKKEWARPEIKINESSYSRSTTTPQCEGCTWSCNTCPYS